MCPRENSKDKEQEKRNKDIEMHTIAQDQDNRLKKAYLDYLNQLKKEDKEKLPEWRDKANQDKPILTFASEQDARVFFENQAKNKIPFLAFNGKEMNESHVSFKFSDGKDGKCYEGKLKRQTIDLLDANMEKISKNPTLEQEIYNTLKSGNGNIDEKINKLVSSTQLKSLKAEVIELRSLANTGTSEKSGPIAPVEDAQNENNPSPSL